MTATFPHTYAVSLSNIQGKRAKVNYESSEKIDGGPPKEFDGINTDWSPEGFLVAGVVLCFLTTLKAIHKDQNLKLENLNIAGEGILDKTKEGLVFTDIKVIVSCATNDKAAAEKILHKAEQFCIISNALKIKPSLILELNDLS